MKEEPEDVDVRNYCRICFEEKPDLISSQKVLVLEDFTCTVEEILLLLSSHEVRAFPTYPTKICGNCKELVEATFALKIMYEKTSEVLRKLFSPMEQQIKIKIESERNGDTDGSIEWGEELNIIYEDSDKILPKFEIEDVTTDTEKTTANDLHIEDVDHPEYYQIEDSKFNGEIVHIEEKTDQFDENSQIDDENSQIDDEFDETFEMVEEHAQIDDESAERETNKAPIEEEQIILQIEPQLGLTRNEKKSLQQKRRRLLEKQNELTLQQKIEQEIEQTLNNSKIELKRPDNVTHVCPICFIEKSDPMEFRKHVQSHKVLKSYFKGEPLPQKYKIVAQPRDVVSIFNRPNAEHWCPYCNESLPALQFGIHLWNHERMDEFYCNKCDRIFYKLRDYNLHKVRSHREEYPFKCNICHQGFVIKYNFDCHMLKHNSKEEDLPYACEECPRKFSNSVHLWRHMHIHNGKGVYGSQYKKYRCPKCRQDFSKWKNFEAHTNVCLEAKTANTILSSRKPHREYPCRYCGKIFKNYTGVYQHMRKTHEKQKRSRVCEICGKSVSCLTTHMKNHSGVKPPPRICDVCGKSFTSVQNYIRHRNALHGNQVSYLCDVCGKAFKHYDSFKTHERIHIGNKCHICPECGKGFLEKSYMKKHLAIHYKTHFRRKYKYELS